MKKLTRAQQAAIVRVLERLLAGPGPDLSKVIGKRITVKRKAAA